MQWANIQWQKNGQPKAVDFDDVYFSHLGGLGETNYVFIDANNLKERFKTAKHFTIIETGFGTGLNFLATWKLWQEVAPKDAQLHFISVEKFPMRLDDLTRSLSLWEELTPLQDNLITNYMNLTKEQFVNIDKNVKISLHIGDIEDVLPTIEDTADAWFLDGFTPSKNPDMWRESLYQNMRRLSQEGTTVSSFTSASAVRHGLEDAGFCVSKQKGFAYKKSMITGTFQK